MRGRRLVMGVCFLTLVLGSSGCGGKSNTVKVKGVITLEGAPLDGATVNFVNTGGGKDAFGVSDSEGNFELTTFKTGDGAVPGTYKVTVELKPTRQERPPSMLPMDKNDPEAMRKYHERQRSIGSEKTVEKAPEKTLHPNYTKADKTPLTETVPTNGTVKLDLNKKGT